MLFRKVSRSKQKTVQEPPKIEWDAERLDSGPTGTGNVADSIPNVTREEFHKKAEQILLATACGDALGKYTEFIPTMDRIQSTFPPQLTSFDQVRARIPAGSPPPYTDDTQMTLLVMADLVDARASGQTVNELCARLATTFATTWLEDPTTPTRAPGNACLTASSRLRERLPIDSTPASWRGGAHNAGGCGAVMRAAPFAIVYADDDAFARIAAAAHSDITHGAPLSNAASAAFAAGIVAGFHGKSVDDMLQAMVDAAEVYHAPTAAMIRRAIEQGRGTCPPTAVFGTSDYETIPDQIRGWAGHEAISGAAFTLARHGADVQRAVVTGVNTPGDSDSLASIAGALSAAAGGIVPEEWLEVEGTREIGALVDKLVGARED